MVRELNPLLISDIIIRLANRAALTTHVGEIALPVKKCLYLLCIPPSRVSAMCATLRIIRFALREGHVPRGSSASAPLLCESSLRL